MKTATSLAALDIKSANLYALRAVLREADTAALTDALAQHMARAGSLFEGEPIVLDASLLPEDAVLDWAALAHALRAHQLVPIGAVARGALHDAARAAGLARLELNAPATRSPAPANAQAAIEAVSATATVTTATATAEAVPRPAATATTAASVPAASPSLLINRPLRSGQRVYARGGDLTIIGMVSPGAEVLADGNIHVYGPLRGKAMAGARGNAQARIFTTQFDPELVAVAGIYHVIEQRLDASLHQRAVQVSLEGEQLNIRAL